MVVKKVVLKKWCKISKNEIYFYFTFKMLNDKLYSDIYTMMNIKYLKEYLFNEKSDIAKDVSTTRKITINTSDDILKNSTLPNTQIDNYYVKINNNELIDVLKTLKKNDAVLMLIYINYQDVYLIYKYTDSFPLVIFKLDKQCYEIRDEIENQVVFHITSTSIIDSFKKQGKKSNSILTIHKDNDKYNLDFIIMSNKSIKSKVEILLNKTSINVINNLFYKTLPDFDSSLQYFSEIENSFVYIMFQTDDALLTNELYKQNNRSVSLEIKDELINMSISKDFETLSTSLSNKHECLIWDSIKDQTFKLTNLCKSFKLSYQTLPTKYGVYWCIARFMEKYDVLYKIVAIRGEINSNLSIRNKINTIFENTFSIEMFILSE